MKTSLKFRIVLKDPPAGVEYGLQQGRAPKHETVQRQSPGADGGGDLVFEFEADFRLKGDGVDFAGPFVQGPVGGRFVYIDIGSYAGRVHPLWNRRLKVPLTGLDAAAVARAAEESAVLEAVVPGTGRDGGPNCATVKPFGGWSPA